MRFLRDRSTWPAAALLLLWPVVLMWPAVRECGDTVLGLTGDNTSGGVWLAWHFQDAGLFVRHTTVSSAPMGEQFWQPQFVTALLLFVPLWLFAQVLSPMCAWNVLLYLGFVLTGAATYALCHWLTRSAAAATLGMAAFTFSPYRQLKAEGHVAYVHAQLLVLLVLALLMLWERPGWRRAALLGAVVAGLGYTDAYYLLLGPVTAVTFTVAAIVWRLVVERARPADLLDPLRYTAAAVLVTALLLAPAVLTFRTAGDEIRGEVARSSSELDVYALRPLDYVLPSSEHPLTPRPYDRFRDDRLNGSNPSESFAYVGILTGALAAVAAWGALRSRSARRRPLHPPSAMTTGFAVATLVAVAVAAFAFALPANNHLGPLSIPGPSKVVYRFVPLWRTYARFFIVFDIAIVALASIATARILRHRPEHVRTKVAVALVAVVLFESVPALPRISYDYDDAPPVYAWLADRPELDTVGEYPLLTPEADPNHRYLTFQPVHGRPLLNVRGAPSDDDALRRGLVGLADGQTLPVLRALGVDAVVVHPRLYGRRFRLPADEKPDGLRLLRSFPVAGNPSPEVAKADVYAVEDGPRADAAVAFVSGFHLPEHDRWKGFRWMPERATIEVVALRPGVSRARVTLRAIEFNRGRTIVVGQDGVELWRGIVQGHTTIEFTAAVGRPLELISLDGTTTIAAAGGEPGDQRPISIGITDVGLPVAV